MGGQSHPHEQISSFAPFLYRVENLQLATVSCMAAFHGIPATRHKERQKHVWIKLPFLAAPWSSAKRPQGPRSSSQSALPPPAHSCPAVSADIPSTPAQCKALEEGQKDGCHFGVRGSALSREASKQPAQPNIKALISRIGFWGPLYCIIIVRNPQNSIGNYLGPYITETP